MLLKKGCVVRYLEMLVLKRIDAWGLGCVIGALALISHRLLNLQTGLLLLVITALYWLSYWLNDYYDIPYDRCDKAKARLNFFIQHPIGPAHVRIVCLVVIGFSISTMLSFGLAPALAPLLTLLVMWAYSAPPLRLKSRPGFDVFIHALFVQPWAYWVVLWLTGTTYTLLDYLMLTILFLTSLSGQLNQQVRDFSVDCQNDTNFATRFGLVNTFRLLKISSSAAILLCIGGAVLGVIPWLFLPFCLLALPKLVHHLLYTRSNSGRVYPQSMIYAAMLLALAYTGVLLMVGLPYPLPDL